MTGMVFHLTFLTEGCFILPTFGRAPLLVTNQRDVKDGRPEVPGVPLLKKLKKNLTSDSGFDIL